jgi:hypothetical protein
MSDLTRQVNAWIYLDEDEPQGTSYRTPASCYQQLIVHDVYGAVDMLDVCFFVTVPTSATSVPPGDGTSYTLQIGNRDAKHPDGSTTAQYLKWTIDDARRVNPAIKVLATLGYGSSQLSAVFSNPQMTPLQNAEAYAANLVAYLLRNDLDGFDVDWEAPLDTSISSSQFALLFRAIRSAFDALPGGHIYLTLSPASVGNLDASTINDCFDFVSLQLYSGFTFLEQFVDAGIRKSLLAYGAKFESVGPESQSPYQDAWGAYRGYQSGGYRVLTQWRLNSGDYQFEQAEQMLLHQLVCGPKGFSFDDGPIIGAAGNPPITRVAVRHGDVLDAIQVTNTGMFQGTRLPYTLPQHGGGGGELTVVDVPAGDALTEVTGYLGEWFGWSCVLQITLKTRQGRSFGPFGTMEHATSSTPFSFIDATGRSIVAFSGSLVAVPQAAGGTSQIVASLGVTVAP